MERYLHYAAASDDGDCDCETPCARRCESRKHIIPLLECALPPLDEGSHSPFADHEGKRDKMIFSRKNIQTYFGQPAIIKKLLDCECHPCKQAREEKSALDEKERLAIIENSKDGQILFALMIYLGKFHFVYKWFASSYREGDLGHAISQLHVPFSSLITNDMEKSLFKEACDQTLKMLNPVHFSFSASEPPKDYADSERFPFRTEDPIQGGHFGTLRKLELFEEYYDHSIEARMKDYGRSVVGHGSERKLLFAIKSVKTSDRDNLALSEQEMLRMVSNMESTDAKNIVTLLACYTWRREMHFVFPYIETDLYKLLRQESINGTYPRFNNQPLPENALWREMVGVARALRAIHTEIKNPFERVRGKVFACHFDLKPANILVTADGKLKIGDFGHSHIQIVDPEGQPKIQYRGGDPKYAAPESRWDMDRTDEWLEPHEDGGAPALKYDVWSLACIMTEVLIYLLNCQTPGGTPVENPVVEFDQSLDQSTPVDFNRRFFNQSGVKECVSTRINGFKDNFSAECAASQYMTKIINLLFGMFQYHSHERISSRTVVDELKKAGDAYEESRDADALGFAMRQHRAPANRHFREIGWVPAQSGGGSREPISFERMDGITVDVVDQHNQEPSCQNEPCRIRLFYRPATSDTRSGLTMYWVVNAGGVSQVQEEKIFFPEWAFKPTYLFQKQSPDVQRFECILFPVNEPVRAFIFMFKSIPDLHAFQGALLQKKISKFEFSKANFELTRLTHSGSKVDEELDNTSVQFWTSERPRFLPNPTTGGSIHEVTMSPEERRQTMVILSPEGALLSHERAPLSPERALLSPGRALLKLHLSDNQRYFSSNFSGDGVQRVLISYGDGRRHFDAYESPSYDPWTAPANTEELKFVTPATRMDEGVRVKIVQMSIRLRPNEERLKLLYNATKGRWYNKKTRKWS